MHTKRGHEKTNQIGNPDDIFRVFLSSFSSGPTTRCSAGHHIPPTRYKFICYDRRPTRSVAAECLARLLRIQELSGSILDPATLAKVFSCSPHSRQANAGIVPQIGHGRFRPYNLQFIIHQASYYSTLYSLRY
jgi:hypothetical protein